MLLGDHLRQVGGRGPSHHLATPLSLDIHPSWEVSKLSEVTLSVGLRTVQLPGLALHITRLLFDGGHLGEGGPVGRVSRGDDSGHGG